MAYLPWINKCTLLHKQIENSPQLLNYFTVLKSLTKGRRNWMIKAMDVMNIDACQISSDEFYAIFRHLCVCSAIYAIRKNRFFIIIPQRKRHISPSPKFNGNLFSFRLFSILCWFSPYCVSALAIDNCCYFINRILSIKICRWSQVHQSLTIHFVLVGNHINSTHALFIYSEHFGVARIPCRLPFSHNLVNGRSKVIARKHCLFYICISNSIPIYRKSFLLHLNQ